MSLLVQLRQGGGWRTIGAVAPGERPGSLSHHAPEGRQLYLFRCLGDQSVVERSKVGVDVEVGATRAVSSLGFEEVARLTPKTPTCEFWLRTDRMREPVRVRFKHAP